MSRNHIEMAPFILHKMWTSELTSRISMILRPGKVFSLYLYLTEGVKHLPQTTPTVWGPHTLVVNYY